MDGFLKITCCQARYRSDLDNEVESKNRARQREREAETRTNSNAAEAMRRTVCPRAL